MALTACGVALGVREPIAIIFVVGTSGSGVAAEAIPDKKWPTSQLKHVS